MASRMIYGILVTAGIFLLQASAEKCSLTPVIHMLKYPGCVPKPIPSFACVGQCTSYVQVSGSRLWQTERSCMCCDESGRREASVSLFCPQATNGQPKIRKVVTVAPVQCMCRPCDQVESEPIPQEAAEYLSAGAPLKSMPFV